MKAHLLFRISPEAFDKVVFLDIQEAHEMVLDPSHLLCRSLVRQDVQTFVDLHRIGIDDLTALVLAAGRLQMFRQVDGQLRLASAGRANYGDHVPEGHASRKSRSGSEPPPSREIGSEESLRDQPHQDQKLQLLRLRDVHH